MHEVGIGTKRLFAHHLVRSKLKALPTSLGIRSRAKFLRSRFSTRWEDHRTCAKCGKIARLTHLCRARLKIVAVQGDTEIERKPGAGATELL
jgi:hypothetical protein